MKKSTLFLLFAFCSLLATSVFAQPAEPLFFGWENVFDYQGKTTHCYGVEQTADGGFVFAGYTPTIQGRQGCLVKVDASGNELWEKTYSYEFSAGDGDFSAVTLAADGGFILAGTATTAANGKDLWLVKTDALGNSEWEHVYGGTADDKCYSITSASDGGYVLCGETKSFVEYYWGAYILKVDSDGNQEWDKAMQVPQYAKVRAKSVIETADGSFVVTGQSDDVSITYQKDFYLAKLSSNGDSLWAYAHGAGTEPIKTQSVCEADDGSLFCCGEGSSPTKINEMYLAKVDQFGGLLWEEFYGSNSNDYGNCVAIMEDGTLLLAGSIYSDVSGGMDTWIQQVSASDGAVIWQMTRDYMGRSENTQAMRLLDNGSLILGGNSYEKDETHELNQMYALKLNPAVGVFSGSELKLPHNIALSASPNPFNPTTTLEFSLPQASVVSISVYDVAGNFVTTLTEGQRQAGVHRVAFDASGLSSGVYFARLNADDFQQTQKLLLVK